MNEPVSYCVACSQPIERGGSGIRPVERLVEMPQGFGGKRDIEWQPAGEAHADCTLPNDCKFVGD